MSWRILVSPEVFFLWHILEYVYFAHLVLEGICEHVKS